MASLTLVVMAAGIGSRYGGLKQIDPVGPNGEIVIDYSIYDALRAGFDKVVFIIRREIEDAFRKQVGRTVEGRVETAYVFQELTPLPEGFHLPPGRTKPWGTAHAILRAKDEVRTPFVAINADDYYGRTAFGSMAVHMRKAADTPAFYDYAMVGYVLENTLSEHGHVARGVCAADCEGYLVDVCERRKVQRFENGIRYTENGRDWIDISAESVVSMNIWGFTPSIFGELETRFPVFLRAHESFDHQGRIPDPGGRRKPGPREKGPGQSPFQQRKMVWSDVSRGSAPRSGGHTGARRPGPLSRKSVGILKGDAALEPERFLSPWLQKQISFGPDRPWGDGPRPFPDQGPAVVFSPAVHFLLRENPDPRGLSSSSGPVPFRYRRKGRSGFPHGAPQGLL